MPGGPIRVRIAPDRLSSVMPALDAQLLHRQVLDDAVLDVLEAGVVGVEHLAGPDRVEHLVRALLPRHGDQPVQVGPDHRGLAGLLAHALEPAELLGCLLLDRLRHAALGDLGAVLLDHRGGVLAQLALDRLHLLAQEVLALLLLGAVADVFADLLAQLQLGQPLALEADGDLEPLGHVERLEHPHLVLERDVGRVADGVGQRAGLADGAQPGADAVVDAAQLEDLLDHRAVLALELARAAVDGDVVGRLGDLDAQAAGLVGLRGARDAAGDAGELHGSRTAGEADAVGHLRDGADLGEFVVVPRYQEDAILVTDVNGERDVHGGEDHGVVQRDENHRGHRSFTSCRCLLNVRKSSAASDSRSNGSQSEPLRF